MLSHLRQRGIDIVTMDEAHRRLVEKDFTRKFACFTLDDGYRDNRDHALPVFRDFDAPCIVYAVSDFAGGTGRLWWVALERAVASTDAIEVEIGGRMTRMEARTAEQKQAAFDRLHDWLRALPGEMARVFFHLKRDEWSRFMATVTEWDYERFLEYLP